MLEAPRCGACLVSLQGAILTSVFRKDKVWFAITGANHVAVQSTDTSYYRMGTMAKARGL